MDGSLEGIGTMHAVTTIEGSGFGHDRAFGSDRERSARLRLTRRGRVVFGTLATLLTAGLLAFMATLGATSASASAEESEQSFSYVVVPAGSSLWEVASDLDPRGDPRDLVSEIVSLNQLHDSSVQAGQAIAVPLRFADEQRVVSANELGLE